MQEGARTLRAGCRCAQYPALLPRAEREGVQLCQMP
jgi:hypothetical protein